MPWPLTSRGNFVVRPTATILVAAPDSGVVAQVFVTDPVGNVVELQQDPG